MCPSEPTRTPDAASRYDEAAWNDAYDEAMQWRDWQECDRLLEVRELEPWYAEPQHGRWWFRLLRFLVRIAPEVSRG